MYGLFKSDGGSHAKDRSFGNEERVTYNITTVAQIHVSQVETLGNMCKEAPDASQFLVRQLIYDYEVLIQQYSTTVQVLVYFETQFILQPG